MYSGDLNNEHLNNEFLLVRYSDVWYLNGSSVFRPPFEYRTKFSPVFKWHSNNGPFGDRTTFDFEYQTSPVFRSPLYKDAP